MALENFDILLEKYAHLLIKKGINVQKGHTVRLTVDVEQAHFARLLVKTAYEYGASEVSVQWVDDIVSKETLIHLPESDLTTIPDYVKQESTHFLNKKASRLVIRSSAPNAFEGVDTLRIAKRQEALNIALNEQRIATQSNKISWTLGAASSPAWAKMIFPHLETEEEQVDALWDAIFKMNRIYDEDPISSWTKHEALLNEKAAILNKEQFDALHYTAPGTDLTLGLPKHHIWESAGSTNAQGEVFIANMPTEEIFTAPDYRRADGYVSSTKPLSYAGVVIEGMKFTFKDGQITDVTAEKGEDTIKQLIEQQGARSLGEVALVAHKTPISMSGLTFFNTLFDENASNHLAIGSAYPSSLEGGVQMTQAELKEAGLNISTTHVDFMIGSEYMDIDGIREDGSRVPIFRNGEWAI
ncbi:aminopeptidase [Granulicatella sp. zg-ZJ]|uniref:aminopeptidase n=1 Tax=unclassified Granulicatella TaxID=2630493 RepID=UPI0013C1A590|nr:MULTISPECIES: aminopeptidase [unclassified Granulicatella]MBS4750772.1 aminopeptidase [Carnobacteriaceae bacterium zg-ZUI78]NEW63175.1 aminopeptidase [Granulicatella sp. zg-ZJ]NEW66490.1 aminopeptidase [Granulicatella sp. zg-84]QMI85520.1 aminopeptidase [Carnobacteriaceae bacterium zg-84]